MLPHLVVRGLGTTIQGYDIAYIVDAYKGELYSPVLVDRNANTGCRLVPSAEMGIRHCVRHSSIIFPHYISSPAFCAKEIFLFNII